MASSTPSLQQLKRAIQISEKIEALQKELAGILGSSGAAGSTGKRKYTRKAAAEGEETAPKKRKRAKFSPEARAKIAAAQKARWAKAKKEKAGAAS